MSITVEWYNTEKTALVYTYDGKWTWDDYEQVVGQGNALMQSVSYIVHVVVNFHMSSMVPTDVISIKSRQRISDLTPANHGKLIVYGLNPVLHLMVSTVKRLAPQWMSSRNAIFVNSLDEIDEVLALQPETIS